MPEFNIIDELKEVDWNESPAVELHCWRVRLPLLRGGQALQVEWMDLPGCRTLLVSLVNKDGARGREAVMLPADVRKLRALLSASDLTDDPAEGIPEACR